MSDLPMAIDTGFPSNFASLHLFSVPSSQSPWTLPSHNLWFVRFLLFILSRLLSNVAETKYKMKCCKIFKIYAYPLQSSFEADLLLFLLFSNIFSSVPRSWLDISWGISSEGFTRSRLPKLKSNFLLGKVLFKLSSSVEQFSSDSNKLKTLIF